MALDESRLLVNFPEVSDARMGGLGVFGPDGHLTWLMQGDVDEALTVTPDHRHALTVRRRPVGDPELVDVPLDGSPTTSLLASGVVAYKGIAISPDARSIVWSTCRGTSALARVEPSGALVTLNPGAEWTDTNVAWVPGTDDIVVLSNRGGAHSAWVTDRTGRHQPREIRLDGMNPFDVAVSPDGKQVAFAIQKEGIFVASLDGEPALHAVTHGTTDIQPSFRFGSAELLFAREEGGRLTIMTVSLAGGDPRVLIDAPANAPAGAPTDPRIAYLASAPEGETPMVLDPRTGRSTPLSRKLPRSTYGQLRFSPDGRHVAMLQGDNRVLEVDASSGEVLRTIATGGDQIFQPTYTRSELLVVRGMWIGDLWMGDDPLKQP